MLIDTHCECGSKYCECINCKDSFTPLLGGAIDWNDQNANLFFIENLTCG